jgi:short-subunit dehydrogenase
VSKRSLQRQILLPLLSVLFSNTSLGFFDALRIEERSQGVSVTIVCPGGMKTDLLSEGFGQAPKESAFYKLQLPEEIAPSIVRAVVSRKRELYTETALRVMSVVRALFPAAVDMLLGPLTAKHV